MLTAAICFASWYVNFHQNSTFCVYMDRCCYLCTFTSAQFCALCLWSQSYNYVWDYNRWSALCYTIDPFNCFWYLESLRSYLVWHISRRTCLKIFNTIVEQIIHFSLLNFTCHFKLYLESLIKNLLFYVDILLIFVFIVNVIVIIFEQK